MGNVEENDGSGGGVAVATARWIGEAEREAFNGYLRSIPKGHVLQTYEWGEVKAATGWTPHRLLVEEGGRVRAAASVLERTLPGLGRPLLYSPRGPVLDYEDEAAFDAVIAAVRELARSRGALAWKIDPDVPAPAPRLAAYLASRSFVPAGQGLNFEGIQPRFVYRLNIERPLEEILAGFESKTRYNIRLAARKGVAVSVGTEADLPAFYEVLRETAERDRFLVRGFEYYRVLWRCLVERGLGRLFLARYQGELIAGTIAFLFGDKAWYIYGASSNRHRQVMPNYALQWEMIRWAREQGCRLYDFRGISGDMDPSNPLYGLYRFKKGFNGERVEFVGEYDLPFSPLYGVWRWAGPALRRARSRLLNLRRRASGGGGGAGGAAGPGEADGA